MADEDEHIVFQSVLDLICDQNVCDALVVRGQKIQPLAWDTAHLTETGSIHIVERVLAEDAEAMRTTDN